MTTRPHVPRGNYPCPCGRVFTTPQGLGQLTRDQLLKLHDELTAKARSIMAAKNHDYCDDGNPFANFRASAVLGVDPYVALLVRVMDKLQRLKTFANQGKLEVPNESHVDAVLDVINYMVLLAGMIEEDRTCKTWSDKP